MVGKFPGTFRGHPGRLPSAPDALQLDRDPVVKLLGLKWDPVKDTFTYNVRASPAPCTKRSMLSQTARTFDPPGWLGPVVFRAKIFIQRLWLLKLDWDEVPPEEVARIWYQFQSELPMLETISIPRHIAACKSSADISLVGFCDASELGFAAVVYLRISQQLGAPHIALLASKSRVAPLKKVNLPRLELCSAHLLAKLMRSVREQLSTINIHHVFAFSDSTVALSWIAGEAHRWKTFVANRVAEIQEILPPSLWTHVASESNPADCASRGLLPSELCDHPLWWTGPDWLRNPREQWPRNTLPHVPAPEAVEEERSITVQSLLATPTPLGLEDRFSTLSRLKRVVAYCRRFISNARTTPNNRQYGSLTSSELRAALHSILLQVQTANLADERKEAANPNTRSRVVRRLALFVDTDGILRVGGRLSASDLAYTRRHPALLPKAHHFTDLVIDDAHVRNLHSGAMATHALIRQSFWILDGRNVTRRRIARCNRCFSCKPTPVIQPMGRLPVDRITAASPFLRVGVDYAGPFNVSTGRIRGARVTKAYICAFVCFATKAVHLELASDLTTACFLAAYRRFVSRRGHSTVIFSDNGTNFVGAHREFTALSRFLASPEHQAAITASAASTGTEWRFIPPSAPHFGGLWEAAVKSTKHHLRRVVGTQLLTYEEFATVLTQIEAVLNSRPLCPLSSDPSDLGALTPGHFLIQRPLNAPPVVDLPHLPGNRFARWQLVQRIRNDFWKRWQTEYLHTLQQRSKWLVPEAPIAEGTLVLIKDDNAPPLTWPLGRISKAISGKDGVVRVAEVTTATGVYTRPLAKLCPLPSQ